MVIQEVKRLDWLTEEVSRGPIDGSSGLSGGCCTSSSMSPSGFSKSSVSTSYYGGLRDH